MVRGPTEGLPGVFLKIVSLAGVCETIFDPADYRLALKGNQPALETAVAEYFSTAPKDEVVTKTTIEKGHGRIEARSYTASQKLDWILADKCYRTEFPTAAPWTSASPRRLSTSSPSYRVPGVTGALARDPAVKRHNREIERILAPGRDDVENHRGAVGDDLVGDLDPTARASMPTSAPLSCPASVRPSEELLDGGDVIGSFRHAPLRQHGLAIDGNELGPIRPHRRDPALEAALEQDHSSADHHQPSVDKAPAKARARAGSRESASAGPSGPTAPLRQ
jgi:hypothetical protein